MPTLSPALALAALVAFTPACASTPATPPREALTLPLEADDGTVTLTALTPRHAATVLVWWSSSCPCVARYAARVSDLAQRFATQDVGVYLIASNADEDEASLAHPTPTLPLFRDPDGTLARALDVISTPTIVVFDRAGTVRYRGWLDNEHTPGDPDREPWLEDSLTQLLAGATASWKKPFWGCMITRSLSSAHKCQPPTPVTPPCHHATR
ncbi:MAG: redoxin domain-containing protein [Deltaproteobacteria bacterium]|nr:redoxin domain-containing protein [Deltaproteobacteria bacterium]